MALINTLRNKMGKFVVVLITIAILSFILNDLLGNNSLLMGDNTVGEINGHTVTFGEFQEEQAYQERSFALYANRQPNETDRYSINERAWLWLKAKYAIAEQYDELGIMMTEDELWDMIQGKNIDPTIQSFFTDPNTGQFDRATFNNFIKDPSSSNPQLQYVWNIVYRSIQPARERLKYENTVIRSVYATEAEAMQAYHEQSDIAEVEFVYVPYYLVSDSAVNGKITDEMVSDYYNKNKRKFKIDAQRSLKYVKFPIVPSSADTAEVMSELSDLKKEFTSVSDDSLFAYSNSEEGEAFGRYHIGILPYALSDQLSSLEKGQVVGPVRDGSLYTIFKINDIYEDTTYFARARHILIRPSAETDEAKEEARKEAERIISEIQGGSNFAVMARQYGTDGTAQRGGDLGWFSSGQMVKPFETAVFNASATGLIAKPVETDFGYHIIDVTETKTNKMYAIARIDREIIASDVTIDNTYKQADLFKTSVDDEESFKTTAASQGLNIYEENNLSAMDQFIGDLGNARGIVQWAFRDGEEGLISDIYEVNENYVVAVVTNTYSEGYLPKEAARAQIESELRNKLKAEIIIEKLKGLSGSLQQIAQNYGSDAEYHAAPDMRLSSNSVPNVVGVDPKTVGRIFSLSAGETSEPFAGKSGVFIARMVNLTVAPDVADYSSFKLAIETTRRNSTPEKINKLIEEKANIEDKRYKVY